MRQQHSMMTTAPDSRPRLPRLLLAYNIKYTMHSKHININIKKTHHMPCGGTSCSEAWTMMQPRGWHQQKNMDETVILAMSCIGTCKPEKTSLTHHFGVPKKKELNT